MVVLMLTMKEVSCTCECSQVFDKIYVLNHKQLQNQGRRSRSGRSGGRRTNVHAKCLHKRTQSWNSTLAAAAQAACRGCFQRLYSAWLLQSQAAIATGAVMPQNRTRSDLRRPEIQKFPGGGACPQTPLAGARSAPSFVYLLQYCLHSSPAGPVRMSFRRFYRWHPVIVLLIIYTTEVVVLSHFTVAIMWTLRH